MIKSAIILFLIAALHGVNLQFKVYRFSDGFIASHRKGPEASFREAENAIVTTSEFLAVASGPPTTPFTNMYLAFHMALAGPINEALKPNEWEDSSFENVRNQIVKSILALNALFKKKTDKILKECLALCPPGFEANWPLSKLDSGVSMAIAKITRRKEKFFLDLFAGGNVRVATFRKNQSKSSSGFYYKLIRFTPITFADLDPSLTVRMMDEQSPMKLQDQIYSWETQEDDLVILANSGLFDTLPITFLAFLINLLSQELVSWEELPSDWQPDFGLFLTNLFSVAEANEEVIRNHLSKQVKNSLFSSKNKSLMSLDQFQERPTQLSVSSPWLERPQNSAKTAEKSLYDNRADLDWPRTSIGQDPLRQNIGSAQSPFSRPLDIFTDDHNSSHEKSEFYFGLKDSKSDLGMKMEPESGFDSAEDPLDDLLWFLQQPSEDSFSPTKEEEFDSAINELMGDWTLPLIPPSNTQDPPNPHTYTQKPALQKETERQEESTRSFQNLKEEGQPKEIKGEDIFVGEKKRAGTPLEPDEELENISQKKRKMDDSFPSFSLVEKFLKCPIDLLFCLNCLKHSQGLDKQITISETIPKEIDDFLAANFHLSESGINNFRRRFDAQKFSGYLASAAKLIMGSGRYMPSPRYVRSVRFASVTEMPTASLKDIAVTGALVMSLAEHSEEDARKMFMTQSSNLLRVLDRQMKAKVEAFIKADRSPADLLGGQEIFPARESTARGSTHSDPAPQELSFEPPIFIQSTKKLI